MDSHPQVSLCCEMIPSMTLFTGKHFSEPHISFGISCSHVKQHLYIIFDIKMSFFNLLLTVLSQAMQSQQYLPAVIS